MDSPSFILRGLRSDPASFYCRRYEMQSDDSPQTEGGVGHRSAKRYSRPRSERRTLKLSVVRTFWREHQYRGSPSSSITTTDSDNSSNNNIKGYGASTLTVFSLSSLATFMHQVQYGSLSITESACSCCVVGADSKHVLSIACEAFYPFVSS